MDELARSEYIIHQTHIKLFRDYYDTVFVTNIRLLIFSGRGGKLYLDESHELDDIKSVEILEDRKIKVKISRIQD